MNGAGNARIPTNAARLPRAPPRAPGGVQVVRYVLTTGTHVAAVRPFSTLTRRKCSRRDENSHPSMIGTPRASEKRITRFGPKRVPRAARGGGEERGEREGPPRRDRRELEVREPELLLQEPVDDPRREAPRERVHRDDEEQAADLGG